MGKTQLGTLFVPLFALYIAIVSFSGFSTIIVCAISDRTSNFRYENPFNCRVKIIWVLKIMVISKAQILKKPRVLFKEQGQGSWLMYMYKNQTIKRSKNQTYTMRHVCACVRAHTHTHTCI